MRTENQNSENCTTCPILSSVLLALVYVAVSKLIYVVFSQMTLCCYSVTQSLDYFDYFTSSIQNN